MERTECSCPGYSTFTKIKQIYKFETLGLLNPFDYDEAVDDFIFFMSLCSNINDTTPNEPIMDKEIFVWNNKDKKAYALIATIVSEEVS